MGAEEHSVLTFLFLPTKLSVRKQVGAWPVVGCGPRHCQHLAQPHTHTGAVKPLTHTQLGLAAAAGIEQQGARQVSQNKNQSPLDTALRYLTRIWSILRRCYNFIGIITDKLHQLH